MRLMPIKKYCTKSDDALLLMPFTNELQHSHMDRETSSLCSKSRSNVVSMPSYI